MRSTRVADRILGRLVVFVVVAVAGMAASSLLVISSVAAYGYDSEQRVASTRQVSSVLDAGPAVASASLATRGYDGRSNLARTAASSSHYRSAPNTAGLVDDVPAFARSQYGRPVDCRTSWRL